ncbi:MAG: DUF11 domain-containing protein [Candidatus Saccharibacteria bacterium]|nr:DUF11 domain-containing protein [Candidatus Saccharibacteria bacterium]
MRNTIGGMFHSKAMLASLLVLVGVVITSALAQAWGPSRNTFTTERPANYITFNSITNSPYGDERNFVRIKDASQPDSTYANSIKLEPGKTYEVYTYFHNNAAANLNLVAENTKLKTYIPNEMKAGQQARIDSRISASNATPNEVYDEAFVSTDSDVALRYVEGSAKLTTKKVSNVPLPFAEMIGAGTLIGTYGRDGRVPGCNEFSGYVTYQFKVVQPNFTIQKDVRVAGQTNWTNDLKDVKAGDTLEYRVVYTNTGSITQNNVAIKDALPKGLTYVAGSAEMRNAATNGYTKLSASAEKYFQEHGWIKIGNYEPGTNAIVRYKLKVETADNMNCGVNTYTNIVSAVTENGTKQAAAKVTAHKQCEKPTTPTVNTPKELAKTGMGENLIGMIGLISLVGSAVYYINSRKA